MSTDTIDADECAELLKCDTATVEELTRRGELPGKKFGRGWVFVRADLLQWIAERARAEAEERRASLDGKRQAPSRVADFRPRRQAAPALPQPLAKGGAQGPRP